MSRPPADSRSAHSPLISDWVLDATVLAHGHLTWEHEFSDTVFDRLDGVALSTRPVVAVSLRFAHQDQRPVVQGSLDTELEVICQRCLKPMRYPVNERFELMLVDNETDAAQVPEPYEPWVSKATHADVFELIEEQLLLALPLIARHEDELECHPAATVHVAEVHSAIPAEEAPVVQTPFGQLRDLMRKS